MGVEVGPLGEVPDCKVTVDCLRLTAATGGAGCCYGSEQMDEIESQ